MNNFKNNKMILRQPLSEFIFYFLKINLLIQIIDPLHSIGVDT